MNNERHDVYCYEPEFSLLDSNGFLKPAGFQTVINCTVGNHLKKHHLDFETLIRMNLSWVLLSLTVEQLKPVTGTDPIYVSTWHSENKGIFFRRELQAKNKDGEVLFNCATYSTMLDLSARSIYRKRPLPFDVMPPEDNLLMAARPSYKGKHEYTDVKTMTVERSYIDGLGHVNNGRYGDFCYDSLTDNEATMQNLRRMELYFVSELKISESFTTKRAIEGNKTIIHGYNNSNEKTSFYGVFEYN